MRLLTLSLLLASSVLSSLSVKVTDSGFSFSLQAVKILKNLMEASGSNDPQLTHSTPVPLCANPELPNEFQEVCQRDDRDKIFSNLVKIITPPDPCEICANAACTGCVFHNI
ncbi:guanylin isoform X1 [Colossoma macropomum]|uniref:guanylin isoform X1 n=1 Tax=Colossoma macropomum TaxID=42526 RepID=UPI001863A47E|nr:guanylin isoform X1 [Colossoma macropomum]